MLVELLEYIGFALCWTFGITSVVKFVLGADEPTADTVPLYLGEIGAGFAIGIIAPVYLNPENSLAAGLGFLGGSIAVCGTSMFVGAILNTLNISSEDEYAIRFGMAGLGLSLISHFIILVLHPSSLPSLVLPLTVVVGLVAAFFWFPQALFHTKGVYPNSTGYPDIKTVTQNWSIDKIVKILVSAFGVLVTILELINVIISLWLNLSR